KINSWSVNEGKQKSLPLFINFTKLPSKPTAFWTSRITLSPHRSSLFSSSDEVLLTQKRKQKKEKGNKDHPYSLIILPLHPVNSVPRVHHLTKIISDAPSKLARRLPSKVRELLTKKWESKLLSASFWNKIIPRVHHLAKIISDAPSKLARRLPSKVRELLTKKWESKLLSASFWNKIIVISCAIAISLDPLFLYIPFIDEKRNALEWTKSCGLWL
ncbi:hypothetical protein Prudu_011366, partial [Prunus dulcis]